MSDALKCLDAVEYNNPEKNAWRRNAWDAVASLSKTKKGLILYLPGSKDLDRKTAHKRGFDTRGMIAIERDKRIVGRLRDSGTTCIRGDFFDVVESWPDDRKVSVLFADLQCGYDDRVDELLYAYVMKPAFDGCVLLLNLQRGRDQSSVQREFTSIQSWQEALPFAQDEQGNEGATFIKHDSDIGPWRSFLDRAHGEMGDALLHRGLCAWWQFRRLTDEVIERQCDELRELGKQLQAYREKSEASLPPFIRAMSKNERRLNRMRPELVAGRKEAIPLIKLVDRKQLEIMESIRGFPLPSYRSTPSSPFMDSVVIRFTSPNLRVESFCKKPKLRKYIAAALAIRTMRMNGTLGAL